MRKSSIVMMLFALSLFMMACRLAIPSPFKSKPPINVSSQALYSTFVPHYQSLQVGVGQRVEIKSYHMSQTQKLGTLTISVNGQPLRTEETSGLPATFPPELASVFVLVEGHEVLTDPLKSTHPTSAWTVPVIWIGHVPGTYDLSMVVSNEKGQQGQHITQRIEVK